MNINEKQLQWMELHEYQMYLENIRRSSDSYMEVSWRSYGIHLDVGRGFSGSHLEAVVEKKKKT